MGEVSKPRRSQIRRNVTALVSAVALACGAVAVPQVASAYVPAEIGLVDGKNHGNPDGPAPEVAVKMTGNPSQVIPGESVNLTFSGSVKAPKPVGQTAQAGQANLRNVEFGFVTVGAELAREPRAQDFTWSSGETYPIQVTKDETPAGTVWIIFFDGMDTADETFSAVLPAKISDDAQPGTEVYAEATANTRIFPKVDWVRQEDLEFRKTEDKCVRVAEGTHILEGGGYGQWLADLSLGTSDGEARLEELDLRISVPDGDGYRDITDEVMKEVEQESANTQLLDSEGRSKQYPGTVWQEVFNWRYDTTNFTGDVWLPSGTKLEFTQNVRDTSGSCDDQRWENLGHRMFVSSGRTDLVANGAAGTRIQVVASKPVTASVGDRVWVDTNRNGLQEEGESGLADVSVTVTGKVNGEDKTYATKTNKDGNWKVEGLTPGVEYTVTFQIPDGYEVTKTVEGQPEKDSNGLTSTVTLEAGQYDDTIDLGLVKSETTTPTSTPATPTATTTTDCDCTPTTVTESTTIPTTVQVPTTVTTTTTETEVINDSEAVKIGDKVFIDKNGNGKQDEDETEGVGGITVVITNTQTGNVSRTVTDKDGNWKAIGKPGTYEVTFEIGRRVASDPKLVTRTITLKPGDENFDIDLPVLPEGTVGDFVWNDVNGDGKQDQGEAGVPNVAVKVSRDGEPSRFAVTDKDGKWNIEGLTPNAEYTVTYIQPEGWNVTGKVPNATDQAGVTTSITLKPGEANNDIDLGLQRDNTVPDPKPGTLGGIIWLDGDRDGNNNGNDKGYEGIEVRIYEPGKTEPFKTTTTDKGGSWLFTGLDQGVDYRVEYNIPDGFDVTKQPDNTTVVNNKVELSITLDGNKPVDLDYDFGVGRSSTVVTKTVTTTVTAPKETITESEGSSADVLERCWANAVGSPLLYLTPIALLGALGGKLAEPYLGAVNQQLAQFNAQIQDAINRNTPDWGIRGRDGNRNDPFASFRAQINAANREMARIANDPQTRQLGAIAAGLIGLIAAGAVVYDWCSNEVGDAVTSSSKGDGATKPSTATEPATR